MKSSLQAEILVFSCSSAHELTEHSEFSMNILITGANRGLGLEMTKQSLASGHTVFATARNPAAAADLNATGATVLACDVTDPDSVNAMARAVGDAVGDAGLDLLINNAGLFGDKDSPTMWELTPEQLMDTYQANCLGPWLVTKALEEHVAASDRKLIVHISSYMGSLQHAADDGADAHLAYRSSKTALNMLHLCMASALRKKHADLTCLALHPGWVQTDMGGDQAPLQIPDAVGRILKTVHAATREQHGAFIDLDNNTMPW